MGLKTHASNLFQVIVATNIAETSLTLEGVVYVIDRSAMTYQPDTLVVFSVGRVQRRYQWGGNGMQRPSVYTPSFDLASRLFIIRPF